MPEKNKSGFPAKGLELWEWDGSKTRRQWLRRLWGVSGFVVRRGENLCADLIDDVGGMELVAPVSFFACLSSSRY